MLRSFDFRDFPPDVVAAAKKGRTVSVCLPARNEQATVGATVDTIRRELIDRAPVVDEVVVIDDGSDDATARVAADAGATVHAAADILPEFGAGPGKGQAMWRGVHASSGDVIAFCDADIRDFDAGFVLGLVGPLVTRDDVLFVKGFYERPLDGRPGEGGRVTELMARPLISTFFPHLHALRQPLAGECASRRSVLEGLPFVDGYGVDLGLLIDVTARHGVDGLVQADLGSRVHRNRPLSELSIQSLAILQLALRRAGVIDAESAAAARPFHLLRPGADPVAVPHDELPPLRDVPAHRKSA